MTRPVHRSTLAEQLQRTLRMPQQSKTGLGKIFGKAAKTALSGIAVYVVINVLSGKTGQKRLRQDFAIVTVSMLPSLSQQSLPAPFLGPMFMICLLASGINLREGNHYRTGALTTRELT